MATSKRYASLTELKDSLDIDDTIDDLRLGSVLDAASRAVDNYCGRRFYTTSSDEVRYYQSDYGDTLLCPDDIVSVTSIAVDGDGDRTYEDDWESTDWDLMPHNAATDGEAYAFIETTPQGDYSFTATSKGIKITGKFGWPSVPDPIRESTLLIASKVFKRKDAIFGVMGVSELGIVRKIIRQDDELKMMLEHYRRVV